MREFALDQFSSHDIFKNNFAGDFFPASPLPLQKTAVIVKDLCDSKIYLSKYILIKQNWVELPFSNMTAEGLWAWAAWTNADADRNILALLLNFGLFLRHAVDDIATRIFHSFQWAVKYVHMGIVMKRRAEGVFTTSTPPWWRWFGCRLLIAVVSAWNLTLLTGSFPSHDERGWRCEMCTSTLCSYSSRSFVLEPGSFSLHCLAWGVAIAHTYCHEVIDVLAV